MNFSTNKNSIITIKQGDSNFIINDGFTYTHRAALEISIRCPEKYKDIILECIRYGWLKPVAHVTERELLFMGLSDDQ